jgi:hypothetical protein
MTIVSHSADRGNQVSGSLGVVSGRVAIGVFPAGVCDRRPDGFRPYIGQSDLVAETMVYGQFEEVGEIEYRL